MKKKFLIVLAIILVLIQFVRIDKTNPELVIENDFIEIMKPKAEITSMIKASCYDCHSNQSNYPWYTNVAPVSWLVKNHINEGRRHFNFSEWNQYSLEDRKEILHECAEEVVEKVMPMKPYLLVHSEANLTDEQRTQLSAFFESF
tara:strand:+ start:1030 stop:1464 length:435 start_codon:yes stop_codon:yes gene_type:complete